VLQLFELEEKIEKEIIMIKDVEKLTANDVVMKKVLCPVCKEKEFKKWPLGWDAHAATNCKKLKGTSPDERKRNFKNLFKHLFR
jgi:hypothetical protein